MRAEQQREEMSQAAPRRRVHWSAVKGPAWAGRMTVEKALRQLNPENLENQIAWIKLIKRRLSVAERQRVL